MDINNAFNKLPTLNKNDRILLLTHTDMDGSGPAVLLKLLFPEINIIHCSNSTMSETIKNNITNSEYADMYDKIIACDISCSEEDAEIINAHENSRKLILLDHHKSASYLNKYDWAVVAVEYIHNSLRNYNRDLANAAHSSGTSIMFDYLCCNTEKDVNLSPILTTTVRKFVNLIAEYDTWDWVTLLDRKSDCERLNSIFYIYRSEVFERKMTERLKNDEIFLPIDDELIEIENSKIDDHLKCIAKYFKKSTAVINDKSYSIVHCVCTKYATQTFDLMKTNYPDADLYIINYGLGISIRATRSDIDVSEIVSKFKGGGHFGAGGFTIPYEKQKAYLELALEATITDEENS